MKKVIMVLALLCSMSVMAVIPLNLPRLCLSLRIIDPMGAVVSLENGSIENM